MRTPYTPSPSTAVAIELRDADPLEVAVGHAVEAERYRRLVDNLDVAAIGHTADTPDDEIRSHYRLVSDYEGRMEGHIALANMWSGIANAAATNDLSGATIGELGDFADISDGPIQPPNTDV